MSRPNAKLRPSATVLPEGWPEPKRVWEWIGWIALEAVLLVAVGCGIALWSELTHHTLFAPGLFYSAQWWPEALEIAGAAAILEIAMLVWQREAMPFGIVMVLVLAWLFSSTWQWAWARWKAFRKRRARGNRREARDSESSPSPARRRGGWRPGPSRRAGRRAG